MKFSFIYRSRFIDKIVLRLTGGNGGNGNPKLKAKGGDGGNIILKASKKTIMNDIIEAYPGYKIMAEHGRESIRSALGESGQNVYVKVPSGVDISLNTGREFGSLNKDGDMMMVCRGGDGGSQLNNYMAQTGEELSIRISLRLIADVGLVGFPNAGKSSLLKKISGFNAKVANYAFTTLKPQVSILKYSDMRSISMADLPGLIEGAHVNVGLGHHFLKHIERTKILMFVIDVFGFRLDKCRSEIMSYRSGIENILLLYQELELYNTELLDKPAICLLNKIDRDKGREIADYIKTEIDKDYTLSNHMSREVSPSRQIKFREVIPISAATGEGLDYVKTLIRQVLDDEALKKLGPCDTESKLDDEFELNLKTFV